MPNVKSKKNISPKHGHNNRGTKRRRDDLEIERLRELVNDFDAAKSTVEKFSDLPLSEPTRAGLKSCHFTDLTDVQAQTIPIALKGTDILAAAKTGSGKTLAFLVPVLENLYRQQCIGADAGLGCLIVAPTRELAIQIWEVLYKIGSHGHVFAAGLVIGGKSLAEEQASLTKMNIVICTPGRMLQHLSTLSGFNIDNLRMLVLDEADRVLDLGFEKDVNAIIEYLPQDRQTLLFSATQTRRVSDLARLSLKNPTYISVHEKLPSATPAKLQQHYTLVPLASKISTLYSFLTNKDAKSAKTLVFLSTSKQVRFVFETFRHLQPGVPLMHLHGRQRQPARMEVTSRFRDAKAACLFATDIAARGLDFPSVNWVVSVDCPEDADTYIHRVGRTARYEHEGRAVLFLDPSEEEGFLTRLTAKRVPIERINIRSKKQRDIGNRLQAMCFHDSELKYLGQKAFVSYVKSIFVQRDKEVFDLEKYDLDEFAASLGLPGAPRIRFLKSGSKKPGQEEQPAITGNGFPMIPRNDVDDEVEVDEKSQKKVRTKYDKLFERRNRDILSDHYNRMIDHDETKNDIHDDTINSEPQISDVDDDGLLAVKRRIPADDFLPSRSSLPSADQDNPGNKLIIDSNRRRRALKTRTGTAKLLGLAPKKLVYDDASGEWRSPQIFEEESLLWKAQDEDGRNKEKAEARQRYIDSEKDKFNAEDQIDRGVEKERRRAQKQKRKALENGNDAKLENESARQPNIQFDDEKAREAALVDLAGLYDMDSEADSELDGDAQNHGAKMRKKPNKKWFEDTSTSEDTSNGRSRKSRSSRKQSKPQHSSRPRNIEDLEQMAVDVLT